MAVMGQDRARRETHVRMLAILLSSEGGSHPFLRLRFLSWVGHWRGTELALFHWPPAKLYVHLSMHTAFRSFIPIPSVVLAVLYG
jgi:hypothetical protein